MGSFYSNPHEEYVEQRLREAYCFGIITKAGSF